MTRASSAASGPACALWSRSRAVTTWAHLSSAALALEAIGCSLELDVVARPGTQWEADATPVAPPRGEPADAGARVRSGEEAAPSEGGAVSQQEDAQCAPGFDGIVLATKLGRFYGYDPTLRAAQDRGVPTCLQNGFVHSATIDRQGTIWVSWAPDLLYAFEPTSQRCTPLSLSAKLDAMAFVQTEQGSELYALRGGELVAIDPDSLEVAVIGALRANFLVADPYGNLFAVTDDDQGTVHVGEVELGDASVRLVASMSLPRFALTGVARAGQDGLWLFSQTTLYVFDLQAKEGKVIGPISEVELGISTVAATSCDPVQ